MRTQGSFLLRCWLIEEEPDMQRTIFDIQHIQTGEHERVENLADAQRWMMEKCQAPSAQQNTREDFYE